MCGTGRAKLPPCFTLRRQMQGSDKTPKRKAFTRLKGFSVGSQENLWSLRMTLHESEPCTSKYCAMLEKVPLRPLQVGKLPSFRRNFRGTTNKRSSLETLKKNPSVKRLFCCKTNVADFKNPRATLEQHQRVDGAGWELGRCQFPYTSSESTRET